MGLYDDGICKAVASIQSPMENRDSIPPKFKGQKAYFPSVLPESCRRFAAGVAGTPTADPDHIRLLKKFSQREVSTNRCFPPGCGRSSQLFSAEEHMKSVSSVKGNGVGCERTSSELRLSEKIVRNEGNHGGEKVQDASLKGLTTKKKVPPAGKVAYSDPVQTVAWQEDDNVGSQSVCHMGAMEDLNLYRNVLNEEKKKLKEHGSTERIDILAYNILKSTGMWDNSMKPGIIGSIRGVEVGAKFRYRVELSVVGLHRPWQAGIDYLENNGKVIAISIVASGGYENDMNGPDILFYSGQGGQPKNGDEPYKDQKLERGNLALKNSIAAKNFVRVILGSKDSDFIDPRGFFYYGLYLVEDYWQETVSSGASTFKFRLRRVPDQPKLPWRIVPAQSKLKRVSNKSKLPSRKNSKKLGVRHRLEKKIRCMHQGYSNRYRRYQPLAKPIWIGSEDCCTAPMAC